MEHAYRFLTGLIVMALVAAVVWAVITHIKLVAIAVSVIALCGAVYGIGYSMRKTP